MADTTEYFNNFYSTGPGLGNASSYQVSATPWLTGSTIADGAEVVIEFPAVTKNIQIFHTGRSTDTDTDIRIHFDSKNSSSGFYAQRHYLTLDGPVGGQPAFGQLNLQNLKCKKIYLSSVGSSGNTAKFELTAELTGIAPEEMFELTGSGINA